MTAASCSSAATTGGGTVLGLHVYDLTGREFDLGLLGIAQFTPSLVLVLLTGSVADRFDRARVFSLSSAGQAVVVFGLAWYAASEPTSAGPIFMLVVLFGVARAFSSAAQGPLIADIVPRDQVPWVIPRRNLVTRGGGIGAPVLAGVLYEVEPASSYLLVGALLVLATGAAALMPPAQPLIAVRAGAEASSGRLHEALEGWRFVRRSPILYCAISIDLLAGLFGGALALLPALAEDRLGVGGSGVGVLRGAGGFGAGVAAIVLTRRPITRRVGKAMLGGVATFGAATMLLGVTTQFWVALVAMVVLSASDGVSVYIRKALLPLMTPRGKLGRVSALSNVSIDASNELGAFESGVAGQLLGSSRAVVLGGAATLVVASTYAVVVPALRHFDRFPAHPLEEAAPELTARIDDGVGS